MSFRDVVDEGFNFLTAQQLIGMSADCFGEMRRQDSRRVHNRVIHHLRARSRFSLVIQNAGSPNVGSVVGVPSIVSGQHYYPG